MKKSLSFWQLSGLTFTAVLGTLLHFLYDWTGLVSLAPFCAVNESTWEHMKILFFPMLFFAGIESIFLKKDYPNFWWIKLVGIVLGTVLIPMLFYTLNGAFGKTPDWVNITLFFLSAGCAYLVEGILLRKQTKAWKAPILAILFLVLISVAFVYFTFVPPALPLFQDPLTSRYGLRA